MTNDKAYAKRVLELEAEGLCTSDAQSAADVEFSKRDKATPRPWKVIKEDEQTSVIDDVGVVRAIAEDMEIGSLIVKAVNSHDALLEACKEAQKVLLEVYEDDKGVDIFNAIGLLEQAINQATK